MKITNMVLHACASNFIVLNILNLPHGEVSDPATEMLSIECN